MDIGLCFERKRIEELSGLPILPAEDDVCVLESCNDLQKCVPKKVGAGIPKGSLARITMVEVSRDTLRLVSFVDLKKASNLGSLENLLYKSFRMDVSLWLNMDDYLAREKCKTVFLLHGVAIVQ